jgi:hypothetical protein
MQRRKEVELRLIIAEIIQRKLSEGTMLTVTNLKIAVLAVMMTLTSLTHVSAAPDALKGKTIAISWAESRQEKFNSPDSEMKNISVSFFLKTYVSETGRAFTRMNRLFGSGSRGSSKSDQAPTDRNSLGSAGSVSFSGQRMMITRSFSSGARQVSAVFDSGFAGCQAQIVVGKQGGAGYLAGTSMDGRKEYIFSSSVSSESCSIPAGNGFSQ